MKKNYETPVLTTEQFDTDDVITASAPNAANGIGTDGSVWEVGVTPEDGIRTLLLFP